MTEEAMTEEAITESPAEAAPAFALDEAKELIVARGRERGFVTSEDLWEGLPVEDLAPEQVEEFLTQIEEHLRQEGIAGIAPDAEPDAKRLAELTDLVQRLGVTTVFTEELVSPRAARTVLVTRDPTTVR